MSSCPVADTHNKHEQLGDLPPGDILLHTGDCTNHGTLPEVVAFAEWMKRQQYKIKILVPGNHDLTLDAKKWPELCKMFIASGSPDLEKVPASTLQESEAAHKCLKEADVPVVLA